MATSLTSSRFGARYACAAVIACALALGGCAADEVELNGKIFDAMGLNAKSKTTEPKLAARAPLVMPPSPERVPEPGVPPESQAADVAALQDPDAVAKTSRAELERQRQKDIDRHQRGDDTADLAAGPLGPCKASILTAIKQWTGNGDDDADADSE